MNVVDKKAILASWLAEQTEIELAILFGSYAKGVETQRSDIDFAISLMNKKELSAQLKLEYVVQLAALLKTDIDLIDLKKVGQPLLSQIMKYGLCLKGSHTQYAELAIKNINTTEDFIPYIDRMMLERRERWLNNG